MNKLILLAALPALSLAACNNPGGEDTADMAPDAVSGEVGDTAPVDDTEASEQTTD